MPKKKKWGKIGAPNSAKRRAHLKKIRAKSGHKTQKKTPKKTTVRRMKPVSLKQTERFHKHKKKIPRIIHSKVDDREVIYGAQALNVRFPDFLKTHTTDYDIFSPMPHKDALEVERALDDAFGGDLFFVEPAVHPDTWKVKSYVDQKGYGDYTKPKKKVPHDKIRGKKYVKLSHVKKHIKKTLKDPEASWRHGKDRDALSRIRIYEKKQKKKRG